MFGGDPSEASLKTTQAVGLCRPSSFNTPPVVLEGDRDCEVGSVIC